MLRQEEEEDTRIDKDDALIPYIIQAQHAWGKTHDEWHGQILMPHGDKPFDKTDLIGLAMNYRDRDAFMDMVRGVITRDDMIELPWDVAKYGGSPGGSPYAQVTIRRSVLNAVALQYVDKYHNISFGLDADGDAWYVQYEYEDEMDFKMVSWRDASPTVIAHYVKVYIERANTD